MIDFDKYEGLPENVKSKMHYHMSAVEREAARVDGVPVAHTEHEKEAESARYRAFGVYLVAIWLIVLAALLLARPANGQTMVVDTTKGWVEIGSNETGGKLFMHPDMVQLTGDFIYATVLLTKSPPGDFPKSDVYDLWDKSLMVHQIDCRTFHIRRTQMHVMNGDDVVLIDKTPERWQLIRLSDPLGVVGITLCQELHPDW